MKKLYGLCLSLALISSPLAAEHFGSIGSSLIIENISWQPVLLDHKDLYCSFNLPGVPRSGMADGWFYSTSTYSINGNPLVCEVSTSCIASSPPKTAQACWDDMASEFSVGNALAIVSDIKNPGALYCLEWLLPEAGVTTLVRAYATESRFYYVLFEGSNISNDIRDAFFNSLSFQRPPALVPEPVEVELAAEEG